MVDLLGGMVADYAMGYAENYVMSVLQAYMWIIVLISIPLLAVAIAYCFFGIKIYRVLLVISGLFGGGIVGGLLLGLITESGGGAVVGFLLVGALMGALSWYIYKVFLFIQTFFSSFFATFMLMLVLTKSPGISVIIGIIVGMVLGVLICIYTKLFDMITTAYRGAGTISNVFSLFFIASGAYRIVNLLLLAGFTAGGFYVQKRFFSGSYESGENRRRGASAVIAGTCKLVGIEGMYKGFEFDVEDMITLGRDVDNCNVIFPDTCAGVSRIQCQISYNRKTRSASVVDKFSSYGTTLNGTKLEINRPMPLKNGDVIMFGENNVFKLNC